MKLGLRKSSSVLAVLLLCVASALAQTDPLPSWTDGPNKRAIISFVNGVTHEGGADLDEAQMRKWVVVDMKQDWKVIYPTVK